MTGQSACSRTTYTMAVFMFLLTALPLEMASAAPQGLHERHMKQVDESAKPTAATSSVSFRDAAPYDKTFDDVVTFLKKRGYAIDSASRDAGTVSTSMSVKGHWHQTGTRVNVPLIRDSKNVTEVQVAVTQQKRFKALQTEPWGSPKANKAKSSALAGKMKAALSQH